MNIIFASRILMVLLMAIAIIMIFAPENDKKNLKYDNTLNMGDVITELHQVIQIYVDNFIYASQLSGDDIFIDDKRRTEITIEVSSEILMSMSPMFRNKLNMYLSNTAIDKYVAQEVSKIILSYAHKVNTPIKSRS